MSEDHLRVALTVLRVVRGWNQEELAHAAKVRPGTISYYEQGKLVPSLRTLQRLTGSMGYPLAAIEEAQAFIATLQAESSLRQAVIQGVEDDASEDDAQPGEGTGLLTNASRWEIERAAIEVGRVAARITRLFFTLQEMPRPEREPAPGPPPAA